MRAELDPPARLAEAPLFGMTVAEQPGRAPEPLLGRLARGKELQVPSDPPDLRGYVELAVRGGFPEAALSLSDAARRAWIESYIDQLLTRAARLEETRDSARLRRYLEAYAANSAGVPTDNAVVEAAGISRKSACNLHYTRLC